jgi:hypothetical protein
MKKNLFLIVMMVWSCGVLFGQETWVKTFGGSGSETGRSIAKTTNGGYVLTGETSSNDGDFNGINKGLSDIFVMKMNYKGDVLWKQTYGGSGEDVSQSITLTKDGGFIVTGWTTSNDIDFTNTNPLTNQIVFVIKIDSLGNLEWKRTFGGTGDSRGRSVTLDSNEQIVITGYSNSNQSDFEGLNKGEWDVFVIKLDSDGTTDWIRTYGGSGHEEGRSILVLSDNRLVITGTTTSKDGNYPINKGQQDVFVMCLDSMGNVQWTTTFGGDSYDEGLSAVSTIDNSIIVTGVTAIGNGDFVGIGEDRGREDIFLVKVDSDGNIVWKRTFGGGSDDYCSSISVTPNNSFILTGYTTSNEGVFQGLNPRNSQEVFFLHIDSDGNVRNSRVFGGSQREIGTSISTYQDDTYLITGQTRSNNGVFSGMLKGVIDVFLFRIDSNGHLYSTTSFEEQSTLPCLLDVSPNPNNSVSNINYTLNEPSYIRVEVVDSMGEIVTILTEGMVSIGSHRTPLELNGLSSGIYIVRMTTPSYVTSVYVNVLR